MSHANVELARRVLDAFNRTLSDDADEDFFAMLSDDVEWIPITALLDGTTHHGREAVREWVHDLKRDWETYVLTWDDIRAVDDSRVLAFGSWHARGRRSGIELDFQQATWLVRFRNGALAGVQTFTDRDEALAAAGSGPVSFPDQA
ncbi:MAG TPA: nuclear transport factor 2 family protein [Gaiellaceae bacterium]